MNRTYEDALALITKSPEDKASAFKMLSEALSLGDSRAAYALATWYLHGTHVEKNVDEGNRLLHIAAEAEVPDAAFDLAVSYETGAGLKKNLEKAAELYLIAAISGGGIDAYKAVGRCLYHGIGFKRDKSQAFVWLDRAKKMERDTDPANRV